MKSSAEQSSSRDSGDWTAPVANGPLRATVVLPGSKSQTSRALVIGSIARQPTLVHGALASRDSYLAVGAMRQLGAQFSFADDGLLTITPPKELTGGGTIDCGLAGTVMRFGPALAAFANGKTRFIGDPAAMKRPLGPLMDALRSLGARVRYDGHEGRLPLTIRGAATKGESVFSALGDDYWKPEAPKAVGVDTTSSSQYLSALLLASPLFPTPTVLRAEGRLPSWPYVAMSIDMLKDQGVRIRQVSSSSWLTDTVRPEGKPIKIEPDLSNAGPFLGAALLAGGSITIKDWPASTDQVGKYWLELLPRFGASATLSAHGLTVAAPRGLTWQGMDFDMGPCGELVPTVAALCLFATSPSTILGVGHLRGHETDRLEALAQEITRLGGQCRVLRDGLRIIPGKMSPTLIETYDDHRMATFATLVGLRVAGCVVQNVETTAKTLPLFPDRWQAMLRGDTSPQPLTLGAIEADPELIQGILPSAAAKRS